jgi:hypothetical protein
MSVLLSTSGAHNLLESYDDKVSALRSEIVEQLYYITYDDKV